MTTEAQTPAADGASSTQASSQSATSTTDTPANTAATGEGEATNQQSAKAEGDTANTETPADADKPDANKPDSPDKPDAPIEYKDFAFPEGVIAEAETMSELMVFAKDKNLSQEDVQKLVDIGAKSLQKAAPANAEIITKASAEWEATSKVDKEYGGDKLTENLSTAKKALDAFTTPQFRELLEQTGLGNHPEVIRTFFRIGKGLSEDGIVNANDVNKSRSAADILYGNNKTT